MPIIRRSDCVPLPIAVCPVVAVVMLESRVASCVHCVDNVIQRCTVIRTTKFWNVVENQVTSLLDR